MPMSPCAASAGCRKTAGVPVLESVATSLRATCPDFPIAGIDDLAPHIRRHPDLVDLHFVGGVHRNFGHLGEISPVAEMERHAHGGALRVGLLAPAGFLRHQLQHALRSEEHTSELQS